MPRRIDRGRVRTGDVSEAVDDADLIGASLTEPDRFAEVFDRHWAAIYGFCTARAGDDGEDIAAEVFRIAFSDRERFDLSRPSAKPWLFGIAANLLRRRSRTAARRGRAVDRLRGREAPGVSLEDRLVERVDAAQASRPVLAALAALRAVDREIVLLHAWADLTYDEIAVAVDVPVGTVRSRLSRARTKLRAELEQTS